jgi:hypothetical protein
VKIFEAPLDRLATLEHEINAWLKDHRDVRPDRTQFQAIEDKRAVMLVWFVSTRTPRGVGFGEAMQARA